MGATAKPDPGYIIMTDSNSELPLSIVRTYRVPFVRMPYQLDGIEYPYDLGEQSDPREFFARMRGGSVPTTVTYPPQHYLDLWEPILAGGQDILFISFSSRLSNAFEFLGIAAAEARERFPGRRIELFDTRIISGGMALLVMEALRLRAEGAAMDEVLKWLGANRERANLFGTVGDLIYLKRGGRISGSSAVMGTMLDIKPILSITSEGTIVSRDKTRGRRRSIRALADAVIGRAEDAAQNALIILHGDCEDDAKALQALIEEQVRFGETYLQFIGPVIGTHAGPDTLVVCFMGKARD